MSGRSDKSFLSPFVTHILVTIFGISAWLGINGIFVQLPLLTSTAPEKWSLPVYLVIVIQSANVMPLLYIFTKKLIKINDSLIIFVVLTGGVVSMGFVSIFYDTTINFHGNEHSLSLFIATFFTAIVGCTSSVLFLPYLKSFDGKYLASYFIGEGLSGVLPSILALIQGIGGAQCKVQPIFTPTIYFLILFSILTISLGTFILLNIQKRKDYDIVVGSRDCYPILEKNRLNVRNYTENIEVHGDLRNSKMNEPNLNNTNEDQREYEEARRIEISKKENGKDSKIVDGATEIHPGDASENENLNSSRENFRRNSQKTTNLKDNRQENGKSLKIDQAKNCGDNLDECTNLQQLDTRNLKDNMSQNMIKENDEHCGRMKKYRLIYLHILISTLCFFGNGFLPAIQSYSCLPYGRVAYHLAVTLGHIANPLACLLYVLVKLKSHYLVKIIDGFSVISLSLAIVVTYFAAQSLNSPFRGLFVGNFFIVTVWVLIGGLVAYVKLAITSLVKEKFGGKGLFSIGGVMQIGSAIGALSSFVFIHFLKIFEENSSECHS
uniref:Riboflavin transporter n=1 Tax=Bracon brevicornis TaxID=1563983 RepID=A0A6V7HPH6_9HYME